jgi:uncharacterized membrane protein
MQWLSTIFYWMLGLNQPSSVRSVTEWQWYASSPLAHGILIGLCVLAIAAAALALMTKVGLPWGMRLLLAGVRLAGFAILIVLLMQVELRLTATRALRPNVAVVTDTSGSMGIPDVQDKSRLEAGLAFRGRLIDELKGKADIAQYSLDWDLRPADKGDDKPTSHMTRLMTGLRDLSQKEQNLQAAIVITDGNDTAGDRGTAVAPLLGARGIRVYPVTFGEPDAPRMPQVQFKGSADYVRIGDVLRLDASLLAAQFKGQTVRAQLFEEGVPAPLAPAMEGIQLGDKPTVVGFSIKPDRPGRHLYRIMIDGLKGNVNDKLLAAEHTVDVIDQRIRVLYVDIPRDERKTLGHWLARDPVIDLATLTLLPKGGWYAQGQMRHQNGGTGLPDKESDLNEYDVIIMGDIPRSVFSAGDPGETKLQWLVEFVKRRGGGLITLGGNTVYAAGQYQDSALAGILPFTVERTKESQIKGLFRVEPQPLSFNHPAMVLENDFEGNRTAWFELPKLEGCNRVGRVKPGASLLAIRTLPEGPMPVIAAQNVGKGRVFSLAVDTTWRWEMQRPRGSEEKGLPEGPDYFRRFWGNTVRYLAPDPRLQPDRPQISVRSTGTDVGQTITLATRLVDRVYEPIRKADLTIRVTSPSGRMLRIFPCDGRSQPGVYEYPVFLDEAGLWKIEALHNEKDILAAIDKAEKALAKVRGSDDKAAVDLAERDLAAAKNRIVVEEIRAGDSVAELEDPRARPDVMASLAKTTGGQAFRPDEFDALVKALELRSNETTRNYAVALWNLPTMMILFIGLVCIDCFIRKRRGLA